MTDQAITDIQSCKSQPARRSRFSIWIVFTVAVLAGLAASSYALLSGNPNEALPANSPPAAVPTPGPWNGQRPVVGMTTITTRGFEPAEITVPAGRFLMMVDNRGGFDEVKFELDRHDGDRRTAVLLRNNPRDTGEGTRQVRVPHEQLDWRSLLDLTEGQYVLKEVNHPDWSLRIHVSR